MKRLDVAPRSPEWYEARADSWTASAAATLVVRENAEMLRDYAATKGVTLDIAPVLDVGLESYFENTPWKAWAEKVGAIPRFQGNAHTERGQENEGRVLTHFETNELVSVTRDVTAFSSEHGWLLASFDALALSDSDPSARAPHGFPVEAKCPAFQSRKKLFEAKKRGLAVMGLPYYWCQVQHQCLVSEAPYGWFVAAGVEKDEKTGVEGIVFPIVEKVPRDEVFLKAYFALAKFFYEEFIYGYVEPPKLPSDLKLLAELEEQARFARAMTSDQDEAIDIYLAALESEKQAAARRKDLEAKLVSAGQALRAEGSDVVLLADRLEITFKKGAAVQWQKVAKQLAKDAGHTEIPLSVIESCKGRETERVSLQERA